VHRQRSGKGTVFLVVRDSTGEMQCVVKAGSPYFKEAEKTAVESSVAITGEVHEDRRAPGGYEIVAEKFELIGPAERFPITKDQSTEFLLDVRHLWLRSLRMRDILKVRSTVLGAIHEYFRREGFYETQSPTFTPSACEGGSTLFAVDYFGKKAYLSQSWQLYAEAILPSLEKIYTIAPSFRAEKSRTVRHLTEYWHAEMEAAWMDMDAAIGVAEGLISHVCQRVAKEDAKELEALGRDPADLLKVKVPFPRITYSEALELLKKDGMEVPWGKDLRTEEERKITQHFDRPVIVTHYPRGIMAFYKPADKKDPRTAKCFDILCPEIGVEIVGGSERDLDVKAMREALKSQGERPETYDWYFDTRRYGAVPHSGFGMGVERLLQWICKLEHIRDAIPFPRMMDRFAP
jgi:asparaginyl-tRNA synthetase